MFVIFRKINLCLFTKEDRLADKPNVKITCGGWRGEKWASYDTSILHLRMTRDKH